MFESVYEVLIFIFICLFSLCFGSFLNVVIYRLPNKMNLSKPSSHCPNCGYKLRWYDNIPILSYIFLLGKCRNCKEKISPRYMLVEGGTMILTILCYIKFGLSLNFFISSILLMVFICIFFIDLKHYIIPDSLNLIILILGIISLFTSFEYGMFNINYVSKLIGLGVGVLLFILDLIIERLLNKEIMGGGDLKLFTAVGLFLGWELLLIGIFFGSLVACLVEIPLSLNKKLRKEHKLPFGPYLTIGFTISLFFGLELLNWYFSVLL